jgi:hypothetical protein
MLHKALHPTLFRGIARRRDFVRHSPPEIQPKTKRRAPTSCMVRT